jgi:transcriptional regulator with XRE-family HTH domain
VTSPISRTVRRRRLGEDLRRLREAAGMTIEAAATVLECSDSRISLIENGKQGTRPKDVREMARAYGLQDAARILVLEEFAKKANEKGWWAGYEDILPAKFSTYVDMETDAREILVYSALTLHGLLQIPDYARVVNRATASDPSSDRIERLVELRMGRQARLSGDTPLTASFVLDEAALRRPIGGREVMRAQLTHLLELTERPNITVQTLPFDKGVHAALTGPFTVLRFPDPSYDGDVVYVEGQAGNVYLESVEQVRAANARFDRLRVLAQDEESSRVFVRTVLEEM